MPALERQLAANTAVHAIQTALSVEATRRTERPYDEWSVEEAKVVWAITRDFAQHHGLRVPTLAEVTHAETLARGHSDYAIKWAMYALDLTERDATKAAPGGRGKVL